MASKTEAFDRICEKWGKDVAVIIATEYAPRMKSEDFLNHCSAHGGNLNAMILSGLRVLYPNVYAIIPEKLGENGTQAFVTLSCVLELLNIC